MGQPQWVKLYLESQTESSNTPDFVVGLLTSETPSSYVLNPLMETILDETTFEETLISAGMNFISKTYVWRCQILAEKPDADFMKQSQTEDVGGLG